MLQVEKWRSLNVDWLTNYPAPQLLVVSYSQVACYLVLLISAFVTLVCNICSWSRTRPHNCADSPPSLISGAAQLSTQVILDITYAGLAAPTWPAHSATNRGFSGGR